MEPSTYLRFEREFKRVFESLQDLGKDNVLYHYTSTVGLFEILDSERLLPRAYRLNTGKDLEIAVTRSKRPLSSIERSDVRIAIFMDRVKTLRGTSIMGINEAEQEQRADYEASVAKLLRLGLRSAKGYARALYAKRSSLLVDDEGLALDEISELCMIDRRSISQRDLENFLINLTQYAMIRNKEYGNQFEERIRTVTGIPIGQDYVEISVLRPIAEIPEGLTAEDCAELLKKNSAVFVKDAKFSSLMRSLASRPTGAQKKDLSAYRSEELRKRYPSLFQDMAG